MARAGAGGGGDDHVGRRRLRAEGPPASSSDAGLRAELDLRNEKINYKVREHSLAKVPVILVCGKREAEEGTVNIRRLGEKDQKSMSLDEALAMLQDEAEPPDVRRQSLAAAAEGEP